MDEKLLSKILTPRINRWKMLNEKGRRIEAKMEIARYFALNIDGRSFEEVEERFVKHNMENGVTHQFSDRDRLEAVIVFASSTWPDKDYSLESRSYKFTSDNKCFIPELIGDSIFADSLDKSDLGVRLDYAINYWYWIEDYCYIIGEEDDE